MTKALIAIAFIFTILATGTGLGFAFLSLSAAMAIMVTAVGGLAAALLITAAYSLEYTDEDDES